jgi:outer membrane lipoprotein-sorting protein
MSSLRTISSRRLIAGIGGVVVLGVAGVGVGSALTGANPPAPQPLADALHQAATGAKPTGITADVTFTNNLLSSSGITGTDPLMSGASGRLWMNANGDVRIELQTTGGGLDSQIVANDTSVTVFDGSQNTVYKIALPAKSSTTTTHQTGTIPTVEQIQSKLNEIAGHLNVSGAIPGTAGNVPSYSVQISPKHDGGLLGDIQLDWDAANGVPLGIAVYSTQDPSTPVLGLKVNDISYGPVSASDVTIAPPANAKVVDVPLPAKQSTSTTTTKAAPVTGLSSVQSQVSFTIAAPATVDGLPQRQVRLVDWKGEKAALVTYGQGLGGIAVLERPAGVATPSSSPLAQLPTVSVAGVSGHELTTPLGTVVTFTKGGVNFTVAGSVTQMAAETAAGELS